MAPACAAASLGPPASPQHGQGSGCPPVRRRGPGAEGEEETDAQDRRCPSAESGFPFLKPHEKRECQLVGLNADHRGENTDATLRPDSALPPRGTHDAQCVNHASGLFRPVYAQTRVRAHAFPHGWKHAYMCATPPPRRWAEGPAQPGGHPCPRRPGSPSGASPPALSSPCRGCSCMDTLRSLAAALGEAGERMWWPVLPEARSNSPHGNWGRCPGGGCRPARSCNQGRCPGGGSQARAELYLGTRSHPRSASYQPEILGKSPLPVDRVATLFLSKRLPYARPWSVP